MLYQVLLIVGGVAGCVYDMRLGFGLVVLALIFKSFGLV